MTAEKWMRKTTKKQFKRFDLLLRNFDKCCIVDWKFSKITAETKINSKAFVAKNKVYYQLTNKDFKSDVELKFYCISLKNNGNYHHAITRSNYDYKID
jgi:hypothetical protein